ncbi:hypothetical protein [Latilactobacillus fragifolii]|uniref:hypothetical protein n=1 Tax=Latilactobacillus fragifolii TaxID=2814244 RepID=UPI001ABBC637|nr:hypothetical protein [Latilactobacillus fragifolii]
MKKVVSILLPMVAVILVLVGCGKSSMMGEKKTVSEVDRLLTEKGQQFQLDYMHFEVKTPNHITATDTTNGYKNYLSFEKIDTTNDKRYAIYKIQSTGNGPYKFLDGKTAALIKRNKNKNSVLTICIGNKKKLTTKRIDRNIQKNQNVQGGSTYDLKIQK